MSTPYDSTALTAACTATVFKARILLNITTILVTRFQHA